jgi:predicted enzyme related to lactoylglutathione lyase
MTVQRIVLDIGTETVAEVRAFYSDLFGLEAVMDQGWIVTLASGEMAPVQISIMSEGGSGTDAPDMSIEVDEVDAVFAKAQAMGAKIVYGPADEPWGVRRFYVCDPTGRVLNVLSHMGE